MHSGAKTKRIQFLERSLSFILNFGSTQISETIYTTVLKYVCRIRRLVEVGELGLRPICRIQSTLFIVFHVGISFQTLPETLIPLTFQ